MTVETAIFFDAGTQADTLSRDLSRGLEKTRIKRIFSAHSSENIRVVPHQRFRRWRIAEGIGMSQYRDTDLYLTPSVTNAARPANSQWFVESVASPSCAWHSGDILDVPDYEAGDFVLIKIGGVLEGDLPPAGDLARSLVLALEGDPVEEGVTHPLEQLMGDWLHRRPHQAVTVIGGLFLDMIDRPAAAAELLRCIGRMEYPLFAEIAPLLVGIGLQSDDEALREAAIGTIEQWRAPELHELLRAHRDTVAWLDEYATEVLRECARP